MNRFRKRIRAMARLASASNFNLQQAQQLREQIAKDLQAMTEQQQSFAGSLTEEQRTANQQRLKELSEKQRDLGFLSDALGFELEQTGVEDGKIQKRVQEQVQKMDQLSRNLEKQQQGLAADLGVDE